MFYGDVQVTAKDEYGQVRPRQQDLERDNEGEKALSTEGKDKSCEGRAGLNGDGILRGQSELQSHDRLHGIWHDRLV